MEPGASQTDSGSRGQLLANLMHFGRLLRACGLPVGPQKVVVAVEAVLAVGITRRVDFYWALHAVFVNRSAQRELFDQAFHVFWRNPRLLERMMGLSLTSGPSVDEAHTKQLLRRVGEALARQRAQPVATEQEPPRLEFDAALTWSLEEVLRQKDFEQMTREEIDVAKAAIARMRLPLLELRTRRYRPDPHGRTIDMRATLRAALRGGQGGIPLRRRSHRIRPTPLVVLCDISGSMSRYSRMLLHFAHALTGDRERVFSFVFGTRLTNITRHLREKDIDLALQHIAERVQDWSGGTRIGACLHDFNRFWSRRVLGQGAVVLLITDGLDRDAGAGLANEIERLHKSCRRLIWLNPLMRYDAFEPRSLGMRALLPHVDEMRKVHNLESLSTLCEALSQRSPQTQAELTRWLNLEP